MKDKLIFDKSKSHKKDILKLIDAIADCFGVSKKELKNAFEV